MSLEQIRKKIKSETFKTILYKTALLLATILILIDCLGIFLLRKIERPNEIQIIKGAFADAFIEKNQDETKKEEIIASKSGTKYYFSYCSGVKRIKNENRIYFSTKSAAERAGYTIAANCK